MVRKSIRSGKRSLVKTPGSKYYFKSIPDKPNFHHCATCNRKLPGMPRGTQVEIRRMPKSYRSPNRPFGGQLCSPCLRRYFINKNRDSVIE